MPATFPLASILICLMFIFFVCLYSYKMGFIVYMHVFLFYVHVIVLDASLHFLHCFFHSSLYLYGLVAMHASNPCSINAPPHLATDSVMGPLIAFNSPSLQTMLQKTSLCIALYICAYSYFSDGQIALQRLRTPLSSHSHLSQAFGIFQLPTFCQTNMCKMLSH